ncbi:Protein containing ALS2cr12 (ALS2CR12) signature [Caenorhabditis elegans]|uniref:Protein containing ALS2cr12 (ALS2CR12) signature n=1 Tax=Caenorhabditis elegans TaxID=6239 RepID=G5ED04_CAEEL|nr:Protein containing ALS2cr12 (ALS2CR12) signature [Caenorhabditis elegans]CAB07365.2 Protein containing ALS2cr12 (ALS2CR12) signature [Caenorhabditis elegans]|eukprot:NP_493302.2 Protein containing ALS2cr12 (ALS2CR12) signature [Caenorhabditis elegans]
MGDDAYNSAVEASERRLSNLRAFNRESINELQNKIVNEQTQHVERIAQKEENHRQDMLQNFKSSLAERKAAEERHNKAIEELKRSHKNDKKKLESELESIKRKGEKDVREIEQQREALEKQRTEDLVNHQETMRKLNETKFEAIKKKRDEQQTLKMEEMDEKSKRMAIEHQTRMTNIEDTQNMQLGIESSNASLAMIKKLKNSIDVVNKTTELLQELKNTCEDKDQDYHATAIKAIKYYTGEIEMAKSKFDFQIQQLKSNMYDEREADPRVVDGCLEMANKMKRCMESSDIRLVCSTLPRLAAKQDHGRISGILEKIDNLTRDMVAIREETESNSIKWRRISTSSASASTNAIGN